MFVLSYVVELYGDKDEESAFNIIFQAYKPEQQCEIPHKSRNVKFKTRLEVIGKSPLFRDMRALNAFVDKDEELKWKTHMTEVLQWMATCSSEGTGKEGELVGDLVC